MRHVIRLLPRLDVQKWPKAHRNLKISAARPKILLWYDLLFLSRVTGAFEEKRLGGCHASQPSLKSGTKISSCGAASIPPKMVNFCLEEINFAFRPASFKVLKSSLSLQGRHASLGLKSRSYQYSRPNLDGFVSSEHLLKSVHIITHHTPWTNGRNSTVLTIALVSSN